MTPRAAEAAGFVAERSSVEARRRGGHARDGEVVGIVVALVGEADASAEPRHAARLKAVVGADLDRSPAAA